MSRYFPCFIPGRRLAALAAGLAMSLMAANCWCEESTETAILRFRFRDSETGRALIPKAVIIDGTVLPGGRGGKEEMRVPLEEGEHEVVVRADGFKDLVSRQMALPEDEAPLNLLHLDPVELPREVQESTLKAQMPRGGSVIAGYVVEDETGAPVKDAVVAMAGMTTKTTEQGFFVLPAPMNDAQVLQEDESGNTRFARRGFSIFKSGFGPVERRNVLLLVGIPKTFRIRLVEGTTPDIEDEEENRGNLPASAFGFPADHTTTGTR